jgi:hypothetical protein
MRRNNSGKKKEKKKKIEKDVDEQRIELWTFSSRRQPSDANTFRPLDAKPTSYP